MALNLLPVRVPIGRAVGPDGRPLDVLMTPEFARALNDIFGQIRGGFSTDDLAILASGDAGAGQVLALSAEVAGLRALMDMAAPALSLYQQVESMRAELAMIEDPGAQVRYILTRYAPLLSPKFSGIPTAPTADDGTDTTQIATTEFVQNANDKKFDKPTPISVTGSRGGNAALASLLSALATEGLIINNTTA